MTKADLADRIAKSAALPKKAAAAARAALIELITKELKRTAS
jgi:nucleoid DNA-binding protein